MIDWRSPPFSPIAGHYSRSRNHLPINPFLNSRNPKSPEAASHPISCTEAVVTGCGKYLRELAAGDRLLQGSGDGRLVVKLVLRLEVLADGNAAGPLVGSHFSDPRDDVVDHLCSGVEALLTTQALACEVQGDWGGRQAPSWRCWEEPSWSGVGVQGSRVCVSLRNFARSSSRGLKPQLTPMPLSGGRPARPLGQRASQLDGCVATLTPRTGCAWAGAVEGWQRRLWRCHGGR